MKNFNFESLAEKETIQNNFQIGELTKSKVREFSELYYGQKNISKQLETI